MAPLGPSSLRTSLGVRPHLAMTPLAALPEIKGRCVHLLLAFVIMYTVTPSVNKCGSRLDSLDKQFVTKKSCALQKWVKVLSMSYYT